MSQIVEEDTLQVTVEVQTDQINELTSNAGVNIEQIVIKSGRMVTPDTAQKGDIFVDNGTSTIRLQAGVSGQGLISNPSNPNGLNWGVPKLHYDAIVDTDGSADFTSIKSAFDSSASIKTVFVRDGTYVETGNINIPDGGKLVGESPGGTIINFNNNSASIVADGSGGITESTGTIDTLNGSTTISGTGTTFTNLSAGAFIQIDNIFLEIASITNDTELELVSTYEGVTATGLSFLAQEMTSCIQILNIMVMNSATNGIYLRAVNHICVTCSSVKDCVGNNIDFDNCGIGSIESLICSGSGNFGISIDNSHGLKIDNCEISNNGSIGLQLSGATNAVQVNNSTISHNGSFGIQAIGTTTNVGINNCIVMRNVTTGIDTQPGTGNVLIANCTVTDNGLDGVDFDGLSNSTQSCIVLRNGRYGIRTGDNGTITGNQVEENGDHGIHLEADQSCAVVGNHCANNTGDGINLDTGTCTVSGNYCEGNNNGIASANGLNSVINNNICLSNTLDGVAISGTAVGCTVNGNRCLSNVTGISITSGCDNISIVGNNCSSNTSHGIDCNADFCNITGNRCNSNGGVGVNISGTANDTTFLANNLQGNTGGTHTDNGVVSGNLEGILINKIDTRNGTTLEIGASNATKIELADTGVTTEVQGNLDVLGQYLLNGSPLVINDLNDVTTSSEKLGDVITYNGTTWENSSGSRKFDAYYDNGTNITAIGFTWVDVPLNFQNISDSDSYTHVIPNANVTIQNNDNYNVIASVTTNLTSASFGNGRSDSQMRLVKTTFPGTTFVEVPGSIGAMYNRNTAQGKSSATVSKILSLQSGDQIKVQAVKNSATGIVQIELLNNACGLTITKA